MILVDSRFFYCIKRRVHLQYMVFVVLCLLALSFYFLSGRVSPTNVHGSYTRYFLPVYLLSLPFISYLIFSFRWKFVSVLLILTIVVASILTVLPAIDDNLKHVEGYARLNSKVVDATEPDAIIFLDYWDKAIFPERRVGLVAQLPEENRCEMLSEIVARLSERNTPVYLLVEREFRERIDYETLVKELAARGYTLIETGGKQDIAKVQQILSDYKRCRGTQRFPIKVHLGKLEYVCITADFAVAPTFQAKLVKKAIKEALGLTGEKGNSVISAHNDVFGEIFRDIQHPCHFASFYILLSKSISILLLL